MSEATAQATAGAAADSQDPENPEPAVEEGKKKEPTEYLVLESLQEGVWKEVKRVTASSSTQARRSLDEGKLNKAAKYVAVPTRSWDPLSPVVETQTKISFE